MYIFTAEKCPGFEYKLWAKFPEACSFGTTYIRFM